ncbi:Adenylate kinase 2, chloroplastic [Capsicum annuum]|uniref:adenylate kinase n=1 Tax=Capsicum annuum TaxID=4072 RepID=A0A2G2ZN16_CAPAN|nr:Adenylate kinase 2, chloroplastic [Capsicum annuum]KAF3631412.1 Adenylate kinase 2, chloroplastic [Capsicum annuum]PHT83392.1 Adenylate kinase 2, chloroplastic [Capsicum annuum]
MTKEAAAMGLNTGNMMVVFNSWTLVRCLNLLTFKIFWKFGWLDELGMRKIILSRDDERIKMRILVYGLVSVDEANFQQQVHNYQYLSNAQVIEALRKVMDKPVSRGPYLGSGVKINLRKCEVTPVGAVNNIEEIVQVLNFKYGLVYVAAGDLLREKIIAGSVNGKQAKEFMDKGKLVPDEIVVTMVKECLNGPYSQENGWFLDGYPRNSSQPIALTEFGF